MSRGWIAWAAWLAGCQVCVGPTCVDDDDAADDDVADDDAADDDDSDPTDEPTPALVDERACAPTVSVRAPGASRVDVAGEWNGWTPAPMAQDGDLFGLTLKPLAAGVYAYKFLFDGAWEGDPPPWAWAKWVDGTENRALRHGDCRVPLLQLQAASSDGDSVRVVARFARANGGAALDPERVVATVRGEPVDAEVEGGVITVTAAGLSAGKASVRLTAADEDGVAAEAELWVPLWVEPEPWSWRDATLYFVFTDRFRNGDLGQEPWGPIDGVPERANYRGGDFLGVIHALEDGYFDDLGVDALWLSPVYDNPGGAWLATDGVHPFSGFHGYWPVSHRRVEERFGDADGSGEARLHELIEVAHARGIRVMFDLALNHIHQDHEWRAAHPEWFGGGCVCGTDGCGWEERARDCWFTSYLPDLDYRNPPIVEQVVDDTIWLLQTFDVDGVRVDAAKHMDHVIMRTLRRRLDGIGGRGAARLWAVGETFTGGDGHGTILQYVSPWELDGQFDFPLYWAIRSAFAQGGSLLDLDAAVSTSEAAWGDALMSPFLGNHDVARFTTELAGTDAGPWGDTWDPLADASERPDLVERTALAFAFLFGQSGVPLIYYGDEIGLGGSGDPDNRRPMHFEPFLSSDQRDLLGRVQAIGQARRTSEALRRGARQTLWVDDTLYVFARVTEGGDVAIVALNTGDAPRTESVPTAGLDLDGLPLSDALTGDGLTPSGGAIAVSLAPRQAAIYLP